MQSELVENKKAKQSSAPLEIQEKLKSEIKSFGKIGEDLRGFVRQTICLSILAKFKPRTPSRSKTYHDLSLILGKTPVFFFENFDS